MLVFALLYKIIFEGIYDIFGIVNHTNWDIAAHISNYTTFSIIFLHVVFNCNVDNSLKKSLQLHCGVVRLFFFLSGQYYLFQSIVELKYINSNYEYYLDAMSYGYWRISHLAALFVSILVYTILFITLKKKRI